MLLWLDGHCHSYLSSSEASLQVAQTRESLKKIWDGLPSEKKIPFFFGIFFRFDLVCVRMAAEWTVTAFEGASHRWPHGTRALMADRKRVQEIQWLQSLFEHGLFMNHTDAGIFKCPLSFEEAFVSSDAERIALIARLHTCYNLNWKREATELTARAQPIIVHNNEQQILGLKREADKLFAKYIEDVVLLQALTEELRPETRELINDCTDFQQLLRRMLHAKEII